MIAVDTFISAEHKEEGILPMFMIYSTHVILDQVQELLQEFFRVKMRKKESLVLHCHKKQNGEENSI
jgi:ubiquinone/menaquinone biosynthesis C-methylase UbiE